MKNSKIEWTHHTFNPWIGCQRISPACDDCYAARSSPARAIAKKIGESLWDGAHRHHTSASYWKQPLSWDRDAGARGVRERVFCASLADVFDNAVPDEWRCELLDLISRTTNLDWLLLTKRIGNARIMLNQAVRALTRGRHDWDAEPLPNVWIGATFANQFEWDRDAEKLFLVPARLRFGSFEPLLGGITLGLKGTLPANLFPGYQMVHEKLHWVIAGCESGSKARPSNPIWVRGMRDECAEIGTPFLFKQWGEWGPDKIPPVRDSYRWPILENEPAGGTWSYLLGKGRTGRELDGRIHDEFPAPQRVGGAAWA